MTAATAAPDPRVKNGRLDKIVATPAEAVAGLKDGDSVMIGGFGDVGIPFALIDAALETGARDLTIISNNAGSGRTGVAALLAQGRVRKIVCSYPKTSGSTVFEELYRAGKIELELTPQGTLAERIRAGGAGIGAFFTPTAAGTDLAQGKETRRIDGREQVLEYALKADVALVRAFRADRWGNLVYRKSARQFGAVMATAARLVAVEVAQVVPLGALDPETIVTPGVFVSRVVEVRS
jgi:3-oxoadipate CoA-transferase alpha subunit